MKSGPQEQQYRWPIGFFEALNAYASVSEVGIVPGQMGFAETRTLLDALYPTT